MQPRSQATIRDQSSTPQESHCLPRTYIHPTTPQIQTSDLLEFHSGGVRPWRILGIFKLGYVKLDDYFRKMRDGCRKCRRPLIPKEQCRPKIEVGHDQNYYSSLECSEHIQRRAIARNDRKLTGQICHIGGCKMNVQAINPIILAREIKLVEAAMNEKLQEAQQLYVQNKNRAIYIEREYQDSDNEEEELENDVVVIDSDDHDLDWLPSAGGATRQEQGSSDTYGREDPGAEYEKDDIQDEEEGAKEE
ncbi:hypothetical protein BGW39_000956 [Mortierella sp. 14UC]|nr:hypothetical protein BGW39_000956 [Mortierella sp. 14UC]